jgi:glycosyltransferase involved in cell wall biosynthesis
LQDNGIKIIPVKWNEEERRVTSLDYTECAHLAKWSGPQCEPIDVLPRARWLILPEITLPLVPPGSNVLKWAKTNGMKSAAIFYDLIPLRTRELYSDATIAALSEYWCGLADADILLPISETVSSEIRDWLKSEQLPVPKLKPCILSGEIPEVARTSEIYIPDRNALNLVAIGSWEPRKNYPLILRAISNARSYGADIRITIAGRQMPTEYPDLFKEINNLADDIGHDFVSLRSQISDQEMTGLLRDSHAMVFGSWLEGFGLPVLESLWQGKPCICHNASALAEIAPGGGTVMVDMKSEVAVSEALVRLYEAPDLLENLYSEAIARPLRTWNDYALDVINSLPKIRESKKHFAFLNAFKRKPKFTITKTAQQLADFTQTGELHGNYLVSKQEAGFLIFGPYTWLPAGQYKVTVKGKFPWDSDGKIDVFSNGQCYFEANTRAVTSGKNITFKVEFHDHLSQAELRIWASSGDPISIFGYDIVQLKQY